MPSNPPYETKKATYFGRNRWMTALGVTPWILSVVGLLTALITRNSAFAVLTPHLLFGGIPAFIYIWNKNPNPRRVKVALHADHEGVRMRGDEAIPFLPRAQIKEGFVLPKAAAETRVRLVRRDFAPAVELRVEDEAAGRALLRSLGLDASQTVASFRVASQVSARPWRIFGAVFGIMMMTTAVGLLSRSVGSSIPMAFFMPPFFAIFLGLMVMPSKLDVGADGVLIKWLWQKRFIAYRDLETVRPYEKGFGNSRMRGLRLILRSGEEVLVPVAQPNWENGRVAIIEERIRESVEAYQRGFASADAMLLRRGERPVSEWLTRLRSIGAGANADMRVAPVPPERLFRIIEDPSAKPSARAAAAVAVSAALDDDARARLKAAAEATAAPRLRIALDAAAGGAEDAAIEEALAELDADDADAGELKAR